MEAKDKAKELVKKFENVEYLQDFSGMNERLAVDCAIISADEIISQWEYIDTYLADLNGELNPNLKYWY
ncbi:hypothetical protein CMU21_18140, partial [Elizabethkingia anophelis]|nr:hypothetical protein [Elizabethkingia anophelis]